MKKNIIKIAALAIASAFAISAYADVAIHQNVSLYGYAAGSIQYTKPNTGNSDTTMDLDAAKLGLAFNFAPVTAKMSLYTAKNPDDNGKINEKISLLEANVTYDVGNGLSVTGGRFQSWIGYEAFDIPNANFITNGADVISSIIPNFHEGLRADYNVDKMNFGVAVVNSVYNIADGFRGDGSLTDGYGVEGHFGYNDGAFSVGATLAYQNTRSDAPAYNLNLLKDTYVADVWAQYVLKQTTIGAEFFYAQTRESSDNNEQVMYGLVMVKQQLNEKFSVAGRFSAGQVKEKGIDEKPNFWKVSVQPAYAVTQNLAVGVEVNYTKYNKAMSANKNTVFAGVQAVFTF